MWQWCQIQCGGLPIIQLIHLIRHITVCTVFKILSLQRFEVTDVYRYSSGYRSGQFCGGEKVNPPTGGKLPTNIADASVEMCVCINFLVN